MWLLFAFFFSIAYGKSTVRRNRCFCTIIIYARTEIHVQILQCFIKVTARYSSCCFEWHFSRSQVPTLTLRFVIIKWWSYTVFLEAVITISKSMKTHCIDKKEIEIFLIYQAIQMGSVAKSYMRKSVLIYEEMHKYLTIYEAVSHICTVFDFAKLQQIPC